MTGRPPPSAFAEWRLPLIALVTTAAALLLYPLAGVLAGLGWFLFLAARYDNHTGSCFMVAVLVVIVIATMAFLLALAALPR